MFAASPRPLHRRHPGTPSRPPPRHAVPAATKDAFYPTTSTAAIDDAGTESHACFQSSALNETWPRTCMGYFWITRDAWAGTAGTAPVRGSEPSIVNETYDAVALAVHKGRPQRITSSPEVVCQVERVIRDLRRADEASLRYEMEPAPGARMTLRVWSDNAAQSKPEPVIEPAIREAAERAKPALQRAAHVIGSGRRTRTGRACEYCSAIPGYTTLALYLVSSPALDRPRILCAKHAAVEAAAPGPSLTQPDPDFEVHLCIRAVR